jgi:Flp pilus assembly pilin Flp
MVKTLVLCKRKLMDLRGNCKGVTAMEYGIIGSVTVVVVGAAVAGLNTPLSTIWTAISTALTTAAT